MIVPAMGESNTVPCYAAAYDLETGASHILLKDVSETHTTSLNPLDGKNCELAVAALARLHAFWWDHPRLGKDIGKIPNQADRQQEWMDAEQCTSAFMAALDDQLPPPYRATYERVLHSLPDLYNRHAAGRNLTLAHGDAHLGNFLFPKDAENGAPI